MHSIRKRPLTIGFGQFYMDRKEGEAVVNNRQMDADYAELLRRINAEGLLDKQPGYYALLIVATLALLALSVWLLLSVLENFWLRLADGAFLAFVFCQIGFWGHEAGHNVIFRSAQRNKFLGTVAGFAIGLSPVWWTTEHNKHHDNPNLVGQDPHVDFPFLAFSEEEARAKTWFWRQIIPFQAWYFIPLLFLEGLGIKLASFRFIWRQRKEQFLFTDLVFLILHVVLYGSLLWYVFDSFWHGAAFFAVHQGLFGLYYGLVFAPNHKGMEVPNSKTQWSSIEKQVLTTRDVESNWLVRHWYGGLNHQVGHHLFTRMARNNLKRATEIIQDFCKEKGIVYSQTGTLQSYWQVLSHLDRVGRSVKKNSTPAKKTGLSAKAPTGF